MNQGELYAILKSHEGQKFSTRMLKDMCPDEITNNVTRQLNRLTRSFSTIHRGLSHNNGKGTTVYWYED